jgi:hypothetical protein
MRSKTSILLAAALLVPLVGCQVRQTREAKAPEVEVKGGQLPEYDVDTADVVISTTPRDITVPDVDVDVKGRETTVRVPKVDVIPPGESRDEDDNEGEDPNR